MSPTLLCLTQPATCHDLHDYPLRDASRPIWITISPLVRSYSTLESGGRLRGLLQFIPLLSGIPLLRVGEWERSATMHAAAPSPEPIDEYLKFKLHVEDM